MLPKLAGLTKAMFQTAELVSLNGSTATIRVDNEHHRQNCERKQGDVEKVLSDAVGQPMSIVFELAADGDSSGRAPGSTAQTAAPVTDDPDEHLAGTDVHDLDDAPDSPSGGLTALTEAFPGAELLEEQ